MIRPPPVFTLPDTLFPYTTRFRSPRVVNFRNPRSPYEKFCAVVDLVDLYAPASRRPGHFLYPARAQRRRDGEALHRVVPPRLRARRAGPHARRADRRALSQIGRATV